jgi:hypothetical protein
LTAERLDELVMHDLDELLAGRQALRKIRADRTRLDPIDERTRDANVHVGFEQRATNLAGYVVDVPFRQPSAIAEAGENSFEAIAQSIEHRKKILPR